MKSIKLLILAIPCLIFYACDDLSEINVNPNSSTTGSAPEVFTSGIAFYGIGLDGYMNEDDAVLAQYWTGGPGVALLEIEQYNILPSDFNVEWSFLYAQALSDLSFAINGENEALSSIADILSVHIFQNLVDHYGDIPYEEALRGAPADGGITKPIYNDAEEIYADLEARLDSSLQVLSTTPDEVGAEDLIFGGDLSKWISFANSLKLRILMRQSITSEDPTLGTRVASLIDEGTFIEDSTEMVIIPFSGATGGNFNPQYARRESGIGQFFVASSSTTDLLDDLGDPRLSAIFDEADNGGFNGMLQGNVSDIVPTPQAADFSFPSAVAYGESNGVILMSHWEVMFLRAEAAMRFNTSDDETDMFNSAVTAHFEYVGASGAADYLANDAVYNAAATTAEKSNLIGVQKWISMNGLQESEGWIESRRFDAPDFGNVFTNAATGIFNTPTRSRLPQDQYPSHRLYPQSELDANGANVRRDVTILDKVFWDN